MNLPSPITVIIVEDQILLRQSIENFLRLQAGFMVIGVCDTVSEAIGLINNTKPDLLLLDIGLPDGTGFDILKKISVRTKVIFLTAHEEYAIRAIRYGAIDYLLKPYDEKEFREALQRVISSQPLVQEQIDLTLHTYKKNKVQDKIVLRSPQFVQTVNMKQIIYLEGDNGCTTVYLRGGKKIVTIKPLKDYDELLPSKSFLRTHQSYLVNKLYINRYHPKEGIIYLKDATQIPVSSRKKELVEHYYKLL